MRRKLRSVNTVGKVQKKIRHIRRFGRQCFGVSGLHFSKGAAQLRIGGRGQPVHFIAGWKRRRSCRRFRRIRRPRIREEKHSQLQTRLLRLQTGVAKVALPLLLLQLRLHHVGMRSLTRSLAFLGQVSECRRLLQRLRHQTLLRLTRGNLKVQSDYRLNQPAPRDLQLSGRSRGIGSCRLHIRELFQPDPLINRSLACIFPNRIIRDKDWRILRAHLARLISLAVGLCVEHLVMIGGRRKQRGLRQILIDGGIFLRCQGRREGNLVLLSASDCLRKRNRLSGGRRLLSQSEH